MEEKLSIPRRKFKGWKMRRSITYSSEETFQRDYDFFIQKTLPQTTISIWLAPERERNTKTTFSRFLVIDLESVGVEEVKNREE